MNNNEYESIVIEYFWPRGYNGKCELVNLWMVRWIIRLSRLLQNRYERLKGIALIKSKYNKEV